MIIAAKEVNCMRTIWILPNRLGVCIGKSSRNTDIANANMRGHTENRLIGPMSIVNFLIKICRLCIQRSRQRRHLANLSPYLLSDIGLTQAQAQQEAQKFFWQV